MNGLIRDGIKRLVRRYYKSQVLKYLETEMRACPMCGNKEDFRVLSERDRYDLPLKTQACGRCGLVFIQPMPSSDFLRRFYSTGMYRGMYRGFLRANKQYVKVSHSVEHAREEIEFVMAHSVLPQDAQVLDFGCSEGTFLNELKEQHPQYLAYGVEPGTNFSAFNKGTLDGVFENLESLPNILFDLITSWHVLEHIREPIDVLTKLRKKLNEHGWLIFEVPALEGYLDGARRFHIGHLYYFNEETIRKACKRSGLEVITISYPDESKNNMRIIARRQTIAPA